MNSIRLLRLDTHVVTRAAQMEYTKIAVMAVFVPVVANPTPVVHGPDEDVDGAGAFA